MIKWCTLAFRRRTQNWVALLVLLQAWGETIAIRYGTVPKSEIEQRLFAVENSNVKREQKLRELFEEWGVLANT